MIINMVDGLYCIEKRFCFAFCCCNVYGLLNFKILSLDQKEEKINNSIILFSFSTLVGWLKFFSFYETMSINPPKHLWCSSICMLNSADMIDYVLIKSKFLLIIIPSK